jgi:hypothetical protein
VHIASRVYRALKHINSETTHTIDFGQAWKMYDGSKNDKSFVFYNAPKHYQNSGGIERIWWVETDNGPFILKDDDDTRWISNKSGISFEFLKNLFEKTTSDTVFSK